MWLITPCGFFSIVQKPEDKKTGFLTVRARVRADLERLRESYLPNMGEIVANAGSDYRYRAKAPRTEVGIAMASLAASVDYANFKDEVAKRQGKTRAGFYGKVWEVLSELADEESMVKTPPSAVLSVKKAMSSLAPAYGGVVIDEQGRVLLREPKNHFDGYVWTFPKGRQDMGETPEQTALREVKEETGYPARILSKLSGSHVGGTTVTEYFVMEPAGEPSGFDRETKSVRWATLEEAATLIAKTTNPKGRKRDLAVLDALKSQRPPKMGKRID